MAKKTSSSTSWLTVVKRVFRSPTKDDNGKKSCRRREENHHNEEEEKKRDKRRWLFRKPILLPQVDEVSEQSNHAMAVAAATAAEAVAATAQAAVEIVKLTTTTTTSNSRCWSSFNTSKEHYYAAIVIQTAFRGYLARRALCALKGLVKLQALIRGQNVRKQAKLTLKCMQALVRVQDQVRHQRARLSLEGLPTSTTRRKSMFDEINNNSLLWNSNYLEHIRNRVSLSRERSGGVENDDDWDDYYYYPQTQIQIQRKDDIEEANKLQNRKEASFKREKALAYAFSHQIWRNRRNPSSGNEEELEERSKWLDRWMATKQWENTTEQQQRRDTNIIRTTLELDTYGPNIRKQQQLHKAQQPGPLLSPNIPSPAVTPSPSKLKLLRPSSPRYSSSKEERCYSAAHTPNFGVVATCRYGSVPNYMASTESAIAKSRARTLSAPKQREQIRGSSGCGTNGSVRKRLYYPSVMDQQNDVVSDQLRSPSFKSLQNGFCYYNGMDQNNLNNSSSCYAESLIGRERDNVSACSTTDLRWLK
ncbi:protein IQ-DOMAIN 17 [Cannabis sativa]|uniref:protein IQ-DOMAIN 17 n=1 Tax=Cannabis sativa TaxID=3483 RepID=UPI0029CAA82B|nr:protein IQ-DOMAIN 17 [Cannabis sativa]